MNRIILIGSSSREAALAYVLEAAGAVVTVVPYTPDIAQSRNIEVADIPGPAQPDGFDMAIINPKDYLIRGIADSLRSRGIAVVGPGADGARLEASKHWMKQVAVAAGIPTGTYQLFSRQDQAAAYLRTLPPGTIYVIKTDRPCGGEGVTVTSNLQTAIQDTEAKLSGRAFGADGQTILIEEGFRGPEYSLIALCDGIRAIPLPLARDYKRRYTGNIGPNTPGMGSFAPAPCPQSADSLTRQFIIPLLTELRRRDIFYRGWLYAGLIWTATGPQLLEYNVRLGGPETQVQTPLVEPASLLQRLQEAATGELTGTFAIKSGAAVAVVLADSGYPGNRLATGKKIEIDGVDTAPPYTYFLPDSLVSKEGRLLAGAGGRIGCMVGIGENVRKARSRAMAAISSIRPPGTDYRTDIAESV